MIILISVIYTGVLAILVTFVVILTKRKVIKRRKEPFSLPPGPWGLPILGHLLFLGKFPPAAFLNWKIIYGLVFSVKLGSISTVVINDAELIKEALSLNIFSGRPLLPNFIETVNHKGIIMVDGKHQSEQRSFSQKTFKQIGLDKCELEIRVQEEIILLLGDVITKCRTKSMKSGQNPRKSMFKVHNFFKIPVINSIWSPIIGKRFEVNDPALTRLCELNQRLPQTNQTITSQMSWFFPIVAKFLSYIGRNEVVNAVREIQSFIGVEIMQRRLRYVSRQPKNFTDAYFDKVAETNDVNSSFYVARSEQVATTTDIFMASLGTTTVILDWLLLYMAREMKIQRRLQFEIDSVLGTNNDLFGRRLPFISDISQMPYTEAIVNELLRITSIFPFSVFHRTLGDVNFHGYKVPKNTMIIPNLYAVHHDPLYWEDPQKFIPERFLDSQKCKLNKNLEKLLAFSYGKRMCLGERFARDQMFLLMTSFFQNFNVSCTSNVPSIEKKFALLTEPLAFELIIEERSIHKHYY